MGSAQTTGAAAPGVQVLSLCLDFPPLFWGGWGRIFDAFCYRLDVNIPEILNFEAKSSRPAPTGLTEAEKRGRLRVLSPKIAPSRRQRSKLNCRDAQPWI